MLVAVPVILQQCGSLDPPQPCPVQSWSEPVPIHRLMSQPSLVLSPSPKPFPDILWLSHPSHPHQVWSWPLPAGWHTGMALAHPYRWSWSVRLPQHPLPACPVPLQEARMWSLAGEDPGLQITLSDLAVCPSGSSQLALLPDKMLGFLFCTIYQNLNYYIVWKNSQEMW